MCGGIRELGSLEPVNGKSEDLVAERLGEGLATVTKIRAYTNVK